MPDLREKYARYAWWLLALGVLGRLPALTLSAHGSIIVFFDGSYLQAARDIVHLNFHALGLRPPAYPLLLALCGLNTRVIWFAQSALGITASWMIFDMALRRTGHGLFSLLVGLACSLAPEVLFYESSIMSEALTNFLLVTSIWLMSRRESNGKTTLWYRLVLGSIVAMAGLTRPLMICLAPVYFCFLVPLRAPAKILQRALIKPMLAFAVPVAVLIFGWCGLVYSNTGLFSPTTASGISMMNQVDPYVGLAPERYALLRDAWLQSHWRMEKYPTRNAIPVFNGAVQMVEAQTGKSRIQVSREYQALAVYLAIHHPLLYLRRAEQGWMQFWGEPTMDEVEWPQASAVTPSEFLMTLASFLNREIDGAFVVLALLSLPCALVRPGTFTKLEYLIFAIALWTSAFSAFMEFGENRRFCVPFYMLIVYTLLTRGWLWITPSGSSESVIAAGSD